jgi:hypothetical protein
VARRSPVVVFAALPTLVSAAAFGALLSYCDGGRRSADPLDRTRHEQ